MLKEGGACISLVRRKGESEPGPCNAEVSHVWYAGPKCKNCYLRERTKSQKKKSRGASDETDDISGGDILLEVLKVCGSRRAPLCPSCVYSAALC